jgi:hypothetical protein
MMDELDPEDRALIEEYLRDYLAANERAALRDAKRWKARQGQLSAGRRPSRETWLDRALWIGLGILLLGGAMLGTLVAMSFPACGSECRIERRLERIEQLLTDRLPPR